MVYILINLKIKLVSIVFTNLAQKGSGGKKQFVLPNPNPLLLTSPLLVIP